MKKVKYQIMQVLESGMLSTVVPTRATTFDSRYDACCLAHELEIACGDKFTVKEITCTMPT